MSRYPPGPAGTLKLYIEGFPGFGHVFSPDGLNNTVISQPLSRSRSQVNQRLHPLHHLLQHFLSDPMKLIPQESDSRRQIEPKRFIWLCSA